MLTPPPNAQKRNSREHSGSPKHPRPIRIKVDKATPLPTVNLPSLPVLDTATLDNIAGLSPGQRVAAASNFVCAAAAAGAPAGHVESSLQLPPGSLTGYVLADRELLIRVCMANVEFADLLDVEACRMLGEARRQKREQGRITINQSSILRARAEGYRRLSEACMRKATAPQDRAEAKARAQFRRLWDDLMNCPSAYPPVIDPTVTNPADRLGSAQEILDQLERDYKARIAAGMKPHELLLPAEHIRRLRLCLRRQGPTASQAAQSSAAGAGSSSPPPTPRPSSPTKKTAPKPSQDADRLSVTDEFLAAHPEERHAHQHEHGGQITVALLRRTLKWVETQPQIPLRVKQAASLRGRIKACDLDAIDATEDIDDPEKLDSAVTSTAEAPLKLNISLRAPARLAATPEQAERNERLKQLRAQITMSRRDTRGLPSGAAAVLHLQELEERLAELEGKMS